MSRASETYLDRASPASRLVHFFLSITYHVDTAGLAGRELLALLDVVFVTCLCAISGLFEITHLDSRRSELAGRRDRPPFSAVPDALDAAAELGARGVGVVLLVRRRNAKGSSIDHRV